MFFPPQAKDNMPSQALIPVSPFNPWARAIARTLVEIEDADDIQVTLLHVFDNEDKQATLEVTNNESTVNLDKLAELKSGVKTASKILSDAGFEHETKGVESDSLSRGILTVADEEEIDRIYMYNRKRSPVGKTVFGSTIQNVLSNATVPVIVLPADATVNNQNYTGASE